jgi:hypothetical protein
MPETQKLQKEWDALDLAPQLVEQPETTYTFQVTEKEILDLASKFVPLTVVAMARATLSWLDDDRRKAESEPSVTVEKKRRKR